MQSLKSAEAGRVRTDQSRRLGSQRQNLGEGLMCPAGAGDIFTDVYGRPVSQNTLPLKDSACSNYTEFSAQRRIGVENSERPYIPVCAAGLRGAADFAALGRDVAPKNLYGEGGRGNFVRVYPTANNGPWQAPECRRQPYAQKAVQPFSYSQDASGVAYRG